MDRHLNSSVIGFCGLKKHVKNNVLSLHLLSLNCPTQQLEETVFCVLLYIASLSGCVGRGPSCLASKNNEVYLSC